MPKRTRNIIIISFLCMSIIPFMLLTDFFPFMRFGMFAETIQQTAQKEVFRIDIKKTDGTIESLSKRQQAMNDSRLNYLARKYYYQNKIPFLKDHLIHSGLIRENEYLIITQCILKDGKWQERTITDQHE
jgi:hypothetical protein